MSDTPTRPATITSPGHAGGVFQIGGVLVLAGELLTGITTPKALGETLGFLAATTLVPALMLTGAIGALGAVLAVPRVPDPTGVLRVEIACKAALAVTVIAYAASLTSFYGWSGGAATQTLAWAAGIGFAARVVQISRDLRGLTRAKEAGQPCDPPPLGEPPTQEG